MSSIAPYPSFVSNTLYISGILAIYGLVVGALITQGCILFDKTLFGNQVVYISWGLGSVGRKSRWNELHDFPYNAPLHTTRKFLNIKSVFKSSKNGKSCLAFAREIWS